MLQTMKKMVVTGAVLVATAFSFPSMAHAQSREFLISNESNYRFDHIYVSPHGYSRWGEDQLGADYLQPNYQLTMHVQPGRYDVKIVDRDGDACVIPNVEMYSGTTWHVTTKLLLECEALSR